MNKKEIRKELELQLLKVIDEVLSKKNASVAKKIRKTSHSSSKKIAKTFYKSVKNVAKPVKGKKTVAKSKSSKSKSNSKK